MKKISTTSPYGEINTEMRSKETARYKPSRNTTYYCQVKGSIAHKIKNK